MDPIMTRAKFAGLASSPPSQYDDTAHPETACAYAAAAVAAAFSGHFMAGFANTARCEMEDSPRWVQRWLECEG